MENEIKASTEATKPTIVRETVKLPLEENKFIHIETDKQRLVQAFGEYAAQFGVDETEAKTFFDQRVDFKFGKPGEEMHQSLENKFDKVLAKVVNTVQGGSILGIVAKQPKSDHYTLCLDAQEIANSIKDIKNNGQEVQGYDQMTSEERISCFEQSLKSTTQHEFFHIVQFMKYPEEMKKSKDKVLQSYKLFLAYSTLLTSSLSVLPKEAQVPTILASAPLALGYLVFLNKDQAKIEHDAYSAERQARGMNLMDPHKYTHETG